MLGDIGSILQLLGIYYLVLSLVVNAEVFSFGLVIGGISVGTVAIALIGVGFVISFVFSNYEGSIIKSILSSLTNIVSVLLGVVNVFSDIVHGIRLNTLEFSSHLDMSWSGHKFKPFKEQID